MKKLEIYKKKDRLAIFLHFLWSLFSFTFPLFKVLLFPVKKFIVDLSSLALYMHSKALLDSPFE